MTVPAPVTDRILQTLATKPLAKWQIRDALRATGLSFNDVRLYKVLCALRDQGLLTRKGPRRHAFWARAGMPDVSQAATVGGLPASQKPAYAFKPKPLPSRGSWWLTSSDDEFALRAREREQDWRRQPPPMAHSPVHGGDA